MSSRRYFYLVLFLLAAALTVACAAMQPPNAGLPEASGPPYPVTFTEQPERRQSSIMALSRLAPSTVPEDADTLLHPLTATIRSLPANLSALLYLPRVGVKPEMTEDETREALRRFINDWRNLIGASPAQLSLVERTDRPDGTKMARYEQRPFRYPLRGGYGQLEIVFTADRRLINVSSSCIPDVERLQNALAAITPVVTQAEAGRQVLASSISYSDSGGNQQTYRVSSAEQLKPSELVTFARLSTMKPDTIQFHLAWQIGVVNTPFQHIYVDAVTNEIIAAR